MSSPVSSNRARLWRWGAVWLAWGVAGVLARAQPAPNPVVLPEEIFPPLKAILQRALAQSPAVLEKQLELAQYEARVTIADSLRWPHLGGNIRYDNSTAAVSGSSDSRTDRGSGLFGGVEATVPLFHWGALKNEGARARLGVAMAERNYAEAYRLLAIELRRQFLYLVGKKAELLQVRDRQRLNEVELKLVQEKFARGLASGGEKASREINFEEYGLEVLRKEAEFAALLRTLARTSGTRDLKESDIPGDLPSFTAPPETLSRMLAEVLRDGARSSFEVQVQEMQVREADLYYRIQRVRLLPRFGAGASYTLENTTSATTNSVNQQAIERQAFGVRADWNMFDGFETRGRVRDALASKRLAERRLTNAVERIQEQAQALARQVELESLAVKMTDRRRAAAGGDLERVKDEVKRGNLSASAIDAAQQQLLAWNAASVTARASLLRVWSEFVSVTGADPMLKNLPLRHAR
jgi:outer membrane protein TolC